MKELWLCTRQYPKGKGEAFLQHALPIWKKQFCRVVVIPMFDGEGEIPIPPDIEVVHLWKDTPYATLSVARTIGSALSVFRTYKKHGPKDGNSTRRILSASRQLLRKAALFHEWMEGNYDPERVAVLAIWMEDWVSVLGLVKEHDPQFRFAAMGHGWDLFEHRRASGFIPFRTFQMEALDRLFVVSEPGVENVREKYPQHLHKVTLSRLGTPDLGMAPWQPSSTLRLVSCSYLRTPKRVDLLVKALAQLNGPVRWTHFGDGPQREEIDELIDKLPSNITVEMRGNISNSELLKWYRTTPVDLFVHLSGSEGLPLALMEAASFGIPLLANDVGGVKEIVCGSTGELLSSEPSLEQVVGALQDHVDRPRSGLFREGVRRFWKEGFNSEVNYHRIGELL